MTPQCDYFVKTLFVGQSHVAFSIPDAQTCITLVWIQKDGEENSTWNKLSTSVRCTTILLSVSVGFFAVPPRGKSSSIDAMCDHSH